MIAAALVNIFIPFYVNLMRHHNVMPTERDNGEWAQPVSQSDLHGITRRSVHSAHFIVLPLTDYVVQIAFSCRHFHCRNMWVEDEGETG